MPDSPLIQREDQTENQDPIVPPDGVRVPDRCSLLRQDRLFLPDPVTRHVLGRCAKRHRKNDRSQHGYLGRLRTGHETLFSIHTYSLFQSRFEDLASQPY